MIDSDFTSVEDIRQKFFLMLYLHNNKFSVLFAYCELDMGTFDRPRRLYALSDVFE